MLVYSLVDRGPSGIKHRLDAVAPYICLNNTTTSSINIIIIINAVTKIVGIILKSELKSWKPVYEYKYIKQHS
jgi:hypothetical protein